MAKFFQNLGQEEQSESKKTETFFREEEETEDLSKHERKIKDIIKKANTLLEEKSTKVFDKSFRKFVQDLKKLKIDPTSYPSEVRDVFKKVTNKQNLKLIEELTQKDEESEDQEVVTQVNRIKKKARTLDEILDIEDEDEKLSELEKLDQSIETLMPMFFLYSKKNNSEKMMNLLFDLQKYNCPKAEYLRKNIGSYVTKLLEIEKCDMNRLLDVIKLYKLEEAELYIRVVKLGESTTTTNVIFAPLCALRRGEDIVSLDFSNYKDNKIDQEVLQIIGRESIATRRYDIASQVYEHVEGDYCLEKYALSILVGDYESSNFLAFLEEFKSLSNNAFLLESGEKKRELYRGFYYLENGCAKMGREIIINTIN